MKELKQVREQDFCVGCRKGLYLYINPKTLRFNAEKSLTDNTFNEKKYNDFKKKKSKVYTIISEICYSKEYESFLGYIIADDNGQLDVLTLDRVVNKLSKYPCMNYTVAYKDKSSYLRRNPGSAIGCLEDSEVKKLLGVGIESYQLQGKMTFEELNFCMSKNGYKIGYYTSFDYEYYNKTVKAHHFIFYNKEGTQIVLNLLEEDKGVLKLGWFGSTLVLLRHINHDNYLKYIKKYSYDMGSTNPIDGTDTDILLMTNTNTEKFIGIADRVKQYSTPCIPYYLSSKLDGTFELFHLTPKQHKWIEKLVKKEKEKEDKYPLGKVQYLRYLIGFENLKKYDKGLQEFYKSFFYENKVLEIFKTKIESYNLTKKDLLMMEKIVQIAFDANEL